jgi:hypothetical protein
MLTTCFCHTSRGAVRETRIAVHWKCRSTHNFPQSSVRLKIWRLGVQFTLKALIFGLLFAAPLPVIGKDMQQAIGFIHITYMLW